MSDEGREGWADAVWWALFVLTMATLLGVDTFRR